MRICMFTPTFLPRVGGTEVVIDALARQFHTRGHHVTVLTKVDRKHRNAKLDVPYSVHRYPKPFSHRLFPERIIRHLRAAHQRQPFDVVLAFYGQPHGYTAVRFDEKHGVPAVVVSQGGDLYRESKQRSRRHHWKRILYAYQHAPALVSISPYMTGLIREVVPNPAMLESIPNGIDLNAFREPAIKPPDFRDDRPFCLCLGNLGPMKGFDDAIKAFAKVRDRVGDLIMLIVGKGRLDDELRELARSLRVRDRVQFLGERVGEDKRWLLQNCRFGLTPSLEEGHPIVGLELLSVGKPVICSHNQAFDQMYDEENAIRVNARAPDELAEAIVKMGSIDAAAVERVSRERAVRYAWSSIADRYLMLFERVIERRAAEARVAEPVAASVGH